MIVSSGPASFIARSLSMLRSVGAWMAIAPEQTYVATSIRGLGACKSTYCKAERREPPALAAAFPNGRLAALFAVALAATGLLSGFAAHRQAEARDGRLVAGRTECARRSRMAVAVFGSKQAELFVLRHRLQHQLGALVG